MNGNVKKDKEKYNKTEMKNIKKLQKVTGKQKNVQQITKIQGKQQHHLKNNRNHRNCYEKDREETKRTRNNNKTLHSKTENYKGKTDRITKRQQNNNIIIGK